jgi:stage IV sporulation protein A
VKGADTASIELGTGRARISVGLQPDLFYKVLGEKTGLEINDEGSLMDCMLKMAQMKKVYDKISGAYHDAEENGYGIVMPSTDELTLEEPEIIRQGGKYGIRLKAAAPSIHMMKTRITTEITPIVGSEKQSQELVEYILKEFESNPSQIWNSNIFGKSLHELVNEGLHNKLNRMPADARDKVRETIERIINEGCSGLICIIL